jgi:glycosyltransferase involved in cell wall biosynthesis
LIKIALVDFLKAKKVENKLKTLIKNKNLSKDKVVIYSYWNDYKALACSFLAREGFFSIARCHRWDIYLYSQAPPYLPFKPFILGNLNITISISDDGKKYLNEIFKNKFTDKIEVSKLGKFNTHTPNEGSMKVNEIHIVSCSTLTSVKRVEKIIEVLKILNNEYKLTVNWCHFGDGSLREKLEIKAKKDLINYNFFGVQQNDYLLEFYNENYIDLFINLSDSEGIPVSIMEAQSAGIPVLATDVGGTPEIVNNENGILVDKDELNEVIAQKIKDYLDLPEVEKLKKRDLSYQNWKENYNAETNYTNFIQTIITLKP